MTAIGTVGTYKAPTDMQAAPKQVLARVGPGTLNAAIVTWISEDTRTVNLRVFPDQQESFVIRGVEFGDNPVMGNFNDPEFVDPARSADDQKKRDEKKRADDKERDEKKSPGSILKKGE